MNPNPQLIYISLSTLILSGYFFSLL